MKARALHLREYGTKMTAIVLSWFTGLCRANIERFRHITSRHADTSVLRIPTVILSVLIILFAICLIPMARGIIFLSAIKLNRVTT